MSDADRVRELEERALQGNLAKEQEKLARQNKLFVRDRLALLLDADSFVEDALLANALAGDLPADGVITGVGRVDGRPVCVMANDSTVKAGSWGARTVEKIVRLTEYALESRDAGRVSRRLRRRAHHRSGRALPRTPRRRAASSPTRCDCRARCRRCVACSARRPRVALTSPPSATSCSWSRGTPRCTSARRVWPRS